MVSRERKTRGLLSCLLATVSLGAVAAPPQMGGNYNYGGWTVTNGVIDTTASCTAAGVTSCKTLSQDDGFLQEEVLLDNGQHYIRIIMTDFGATGDPRLAGAAANLAFASEGFTPFLTNTECSAIAGTLPNNFQDCQGLAVKQDIRDLAGGFENTAIVQRNFSKSNEPNLADEFNIKLSQTIDTIDSATGLAFNDGFDYTEYSYWECTISGSCNNNTPIGKKLGLRSTVFLDPLDATRKQAFRQVDLSGWQGRQSGGFFKSGPVVDTGGATESITLGGRIVDGRTTGTPTIFSWNSSPSSGGGGWGGWWGGGSKVAHSVKTTWIASNLIDGFDYQNFTLTDGSSGTTTSASQTLLDAQGLLGDVVDPFAWAPSLGPRPTF